MNTYTLRCGEVVPLGVECALPPPGLEFPTRQWKRPLGFGAGFLLLVLLAFNPAIQERLLPDVPVIVTSSAAAAPARDSLMCSP